MVEDREHSCLHDTVRSENVKEVYKIVNKNERSANFGDHWQDRLFVWNVPAASQKGLEHVVDTCEVCASVTHHWTEMPALFDCLRHRCDPPHLLYLLNLAQCQFVFLRMR